QRPAAARSGLATGRGRERVVLGGVPAAERRRRTWTRIVDPSPRGSEPAFLTVRTFSFLLFPSYGFGTIFILSTTRWTPSTSRAIPIAFACAAGLTTEPESVTTWS